MTQKQPKNPLIEVKNLKKFFVKGSEKVFPVNDISFSIESGKTLGLVGESGSGKSTLAKTILDLYHKDFGETFFEGKKLSFQDRENREKIQIIFQDPYASLNPKMTILEVLSEPFLIHRNFNREEIFQEIVQLLTFVSLPKSALDKYPHEFSGGQRQRIAIARALCLHPKFLILDEPVSALDVSVQAQILNLLVDLQMKFHLTYLFIAHDLAVVKYMSDEIAVMKDGMFVEMNKTSLLFQDPKHPYTKTLLTSMLTKRPSPVLEAETLHLL